MDRRNHWRDPVCLGRRRRRRQDAPQAPSWSGKPAAADTAELFKAHPLRFSSGHGLNDTHIRILRLFPAASLSEPLQGELQAAALDEVGEYEALSYTWEPPLNGQILAPSNINLSGFSLSITGNLSLALRRLRHHVKPKSLWVDAICINQYDNRERSQQVCLMPRIYAQATSVVAWLGEDSNIGDAQQVFEKCMRNDRCTADNPASMKSRHRTPRHHQRNQSYCWIKFSNRRYFHRRWVIQELAWASQVRFKCGHAEISYEKLVKNLAPDILFNHGPFTRVKRFFGALETTRQRLRSPSGNDVFELLYAFQGAKCADDRDILSGSLSLCRGLLGAFTVNYDLSCDELYTQFAASLVENRFGRSRALTKETWTSEDIANVVNPLEVDYVPRLLHVAAHQAELPSRQESSLPTWVPDWRLEICRPPKQIFWCLNRCMQCVIGQADEPSIEALSDGTLHAWLPFFGQAGDLIPDFLLTKELPEGEKYVSLRNDDYICGPASSDGQDIDAKAECLVLRPLENVHHKLVGITAIEMRYLVTKGTHSVKRFLIA